MQRHAAALLKDLGVAGTSKAADRAADRRSPSVAARRPPLLVAVAAAGSTAALLGEHRKRSMARSAPPRAGMSS
jgi:hypothetical protein